MKQLKSLFDMKLTYPLLLLFFITFSSGKAFAQPTTCEYVLELFDLFGDGWNGASLVLTINGERTFYALDGVNDNGFFDRITIPISNGDSIMIEYNPGLFEEEVSWFFITPEGDVLLGFNGVPELEEGFEDVLFCPSCPAPRVDEVFVDDVSADWADISWMPVDSVEGIYFLEYGLEGFEPATGNGIILETADNNIRIEGLAEDTAYDLYLAISCSNGDDSKIIGPVSFKTRFAIDVGIVDIIRPMSSCDLGGNDSVFVEIGNFGGDPQTLIPFAYGVNGVDAGVSMPTDGLYTGVLGKDSTDIAIFDRTFNFSQPGEYVIQAWTQFEDDADVANDTFETLVVSIPTVISYPYFTDFEVWGGGWLVDEESENPSWAYGRPAGELISGAATGASAWVTNLTGDYNSLERSFLVSPCLDFSTLTEDPRISFSIFLDTEQCCDRLWVESSVDGGETWRRVGGPNTGVNWYNDENNLWWAGDGGFDGWVYAYNTLDSTAGFSDVRVRFSFSSDPSVTREGAGIDNILIGNPFQQDLAAINIQTTSVDVCGADSDSLILSLSNVGTDTLRTFDLVYQIGNEAPVVEQVTDLVIAPNGRIDYQFEMPFSSSAKTTIDLKAWVIVEGDAFNKNDTVTLNLSTLLNLPYKEDFEEGRVPDGWITDGTVTDGHGNRSFVLSDALSIIDDSLSAVSPLLGPIEPNDSLVFEYRFVSNTAGGSIGEVLNDGDQLEVQITTDCGLTYETLLIINASNHITSGRLARRVLFLDQYVGENVRFRFLVRWGQGQYFVDIDNINLIRCPGSLDLLTSSENEVGPNSSNGLATVDARDGSGPYTYQWSNGDTSKTVEKLTAGIYSVTVTDQFGCTDVAEVLVGLTVDLEEPVVSNISSAYLSPNPARASTNLYLTLKETNDVRVSIISPIGQVIQQQVLENIQSYNLPISLTDFPSGLYFVRIEVEGEQLIRKLVK